MDHRGIVCKTHCAFIQCSMTRSCGWSKWVQASSRIGHRTRNLSGQRMSRRCISCSCSLLCPACLHQKVRPWSSRFPLGKKGSQNTRQAPKELIKGWTPFVLAKAKVEATFININGNLHTQYPHQRQCTKKKGYSPWLLKLHNLTTSFHYRFHEQFS